MHNTLNNGFSDVTRVADRYATAVINGTNRELGIPIENPLIWHNENGDVPTNVQASIRLMKRELLKTPDTAQARLNNIIDEIKQGGDPAILRNIVLDKYDVAFLLECLEETDLQESE